MKDSKIELHLDILSVFWIIASIVSAGFGFTFGTFGFWFWFWYRITWRDIVLVSYHCL